MGEALFAPLDQPWPRRVFAGVLAVCANALLLALILLTPRHITAPPELDVVDVILVERPRAPEEPVVDDTATEEPPVQEIAVVQAAEPETPEDEAPAPAPDPGPLPPRTDQAVELSSPPAASPSTDEDDEDQPAEPGGSSGFLAFEGEALPLPAGRGSTPMLLREVFCQSSSAATRQAGACPDGPPERGLAYARHGSAEELARVRAALGLDLSAEDIRALFGGQPLGSRDLSGLGTTTNQHSLPTSSADSMRDSLPPLVPDPAFGD
ncbi:hypothetical protein [Maricaulis sp.]|uniref:hypothetical protein n=1 Tax=Maricaulis sp. TaxID=1486257 RepID=UPI0026110724|nr:hypothetical protein [Maricaulis sp.]